MMNYSLFRFLDDEDLAERIEKLERKVEEYTKLGRGIASTMRRQFEDALQAALEEQRRRQRPEAADKPIFH